MAHPLAKSLLISDLHLTANSRDEYRWGLFDWLLEQTDVERLWILGDLTDAKDYHSAQLVNRLVDVLSRLAEKMEIHIVRGNHDGVDPEWPYFRFLNAIHNVFFYSEPSCLGDEILVLPHSRNWQEEWEGLSFDWPVVFLHATVAGAQAEMGASLSGIPASLFADTKGLVLAGDVHVPQRVGRVEYVGAPYPIRFGDSFKGRGLYFDKNGKRSERHYETLNRHSIVLNTVEDWDFSGIYEGDQVKVKLRLSKAEAMDWAAIKTRVKDLCNKVGVVLVALELERLPDGKAVSLKDKVRRSSPDDSFLRYCNQKHIATNLRDVGEALFKRAAANTAKTL